MHSSVEDQTKDYSIAKLRWVQHTGLPLPFLFEATGVLTRFTDQRDPKPRSREVFAFHRPETLREHLSQEKSLRARLLDLPSLDPSGLRDCQINAITKLEESLKQAKPRALIQMATGAGKTFTAITSIYRLLKHAKAKRILFLVNTRNLGEQAEQEFIAYQPTDDNRKFTELYSVQRLTSSHVPADAQVCICTIQRMYSILQGRELDPSAEDEDPAESTSHRKKPMPVVYSGKLPPEFFDFMVIDECHQSIYNLWRQVVEYYDVFHVGLTATPDARTYAFFNQNVVSEYTHEDAVADGVNVQGEIYVIETEVTKNGGTVLKGLVEKREKLTRAKRWEAQDEDEAYNSKKLDRDIVNPSQIRTVVKTFRDKLPEIFPDRTAVTVDMIATGTDVKPLECLLFMRDVKSRGYFEQMKGRGTRTLDHDGLRKASPAAKTAKTHYVIVDAIGVTKSLKTASRPPITKPSVPFKDLAMQVVMGATDADTISSLAGRLARIERMLTPAQKQAVAEKLGGTAISTLIKNLFHAIDGEAIEEKALAITGQQPGTEPGDFAREQAQRELVTAAAAPLTGAAVKLIVETCTANLQTIDLDTQDKLVRAEWDADARERSAAFVSEFETFCRDHQDKLDALTLFYQQPQRRQEVTLAQIKDVLAALKQAAPRLAPLRVWEAYARLDALPDNAKPLTELTALVALIRRACGLDEPLTPFDTTVRRNYRDWILKKNAGQPLNESQTAFLELIRDHIMTSLRFERDDLDFAPFDAQGGLGKMHQLFGDAMGELIEELNGELVA